MAGFYERPQDEHLTGQTPKNAGKYNKSGKTGSRTMKDGGKSGKKTAGNTKGMSSNTKSNRDSRSRKY